MAALNDCLEFFKELFGRFYGHFMAFCGRCGGLIWECLRMFKGLF